MKRCPICEKPRGPFDILDLWDPTTTGKLVTQICNECHWAIERWQEMFPFQTITKLRKSWELNQINHPDFKEPTEE